MRSTTCRRMLLLGVILWCWGPSQAKGEGYLTMVDNGPSSNRVDIVFLGDGYTASQIDTVYLDHIQTTLVGIFGNGTLIEGEDPFPRYRNFFNVHRIDVVSQESGADVPPNIYRDTALDASYYFEGGPQEQLYIDSVLADGKLIEAGINAEMADLKLVPVNDTLYGGAEGGDYAVYAAGYADAPNLALHEIGHAFGNLADEYFSAGAYSGPEPPEVNVSTYDTEAMAANGQKWAQWLGYDDPDLGVIGAYEGANGFSSSLYRPSEYSKMRSIGYPFDAVSREQLILSIYDYVDPLDDWLDNTGVLVDPTSLSVSVVDPEVIRLQWYVDGELAVGMTDELFDLPTLGLGSHSIAARAYDDTEWVRRDEDHLEQWVEWSVTIAVPEPGMLVLLATGCGAGLLCLARRRRTG